MGLFGATTPCESEVERATDEKNIEEDWGLILEVCDKAGKTSQSAKEYMRAILKRINHTDPHVSIQAVTLLDACVKNCGKVFHLEVSSREFETEFLKLMKKSNPLLTRKLKYCLKRWAETEFKSDPQLILIPTLYSKLRNIGTDFNTEEQPKRTVVMSKDPNVVQSQEEEDQIAKAIELSLKETTGSPRMATNTTASNNASSSLYPSTNITPSFINKEPKKVRALYDFEAAEDNELTFSSGEIIFIIDDSDPNWWKGSNQRGEGLFPANFVTTDLNVDRSQLAEVKQKKLQEIDASLDRKLEEMKVAEVTEIDESKIDRLLHLLHEADPTNPEHDTQEMLNLERGVNSMGGLIDKELEKVDRKHAQLTQLSADLVEALSLYHSLMREPQFIGGIPPMKQPQQMPPPQQQQQFRFPPGHQGPPMPPQMMYNGGPQSAHQPPPPHAMMYNTLPHDRSFGPPPQGPNMHHPNYSTLPPPNMMPPPPQGAPHPPTGGGMPPPMNQSMQQHQPPPPQQQPNVDPRVFQPQGFSGGPFPQGSGSFSLPPTSNIM